MFFFTTRSNIILAGLITLTGIACRPGNSGLQEMPPVPQIPADTVSSPAVIDKDSGDSLKNYTYLITKVYEDGLTGTGSCFFIRRDHKLYLISNYHVFANYDIIAGKKLDMSGSKTYLRVPGHAPYRLDLNTDSISDDNSGKIFYSHPDILTIRIKNMPYTFPVLSIEKFIDNKSTPDSNTILFTWGYGKPTDHLNVAAENMDTIQPKKTSGFLKHPFHVYPVLPLFGKAKDSINYYTDMTVNPGSSGSPVFYSKHSKIVFAGVISSGSKLGKMTVIVRPNKALKD